MRKVIYHANCLDGLGAAWVAYQVFGEDVEYIPANYGDEPPEVSKEDIVYIFDFSYPRKVILDLATRCERLIIRDHHKSAAKELDEIEEELENIDCVFDMGKSGAVLAWEYFHTNKPVPHGIRLIQDRDLWQWELEDTKNFTAALVSLHKKTWKEWWLDDIEWLTDMVSEGDVLEMAKAQAVEASVKKAEGSITDIGGYMVPCVNLTTNISETLHGILKAFPEVPFAASYFDIVPEQVRIFSLRSEEGREDVSVVAQKFGGGGHRNAAGFRAALPKILSIQPGES